MEACAPKEYVRLSVGADCREEKTAVLFKTSFESPVTGSTRGGYQSDLVKISKTKKGQASLFTPFLPPSVTVFIFFYFW